MENILPENDTSTPTRGVKGARVGYYKRAYMGIPKGSYMGIHKGSYMGIHKGSYMGIHKGSYMGIGITYCRPIRHAHRYPVLPPPRACPRECLRVGPSL